MTSITEVNGIIYGLTCSCHPDRKIRYVGKTIQTLNRRFRAHRHNAKTGVDLPVYRWMRKHGIENIIATVLERCDDYDLLGLAEIAAIKAHGTHVSCGGLNSTLGGDGSRGHSPSAETVAKIRAANFGRKHSPETRARISEANRGRTFSAETRAKMSATRSGRHHSKEWCLRLVPSRARGSENGMSKLDEVRVQQIKEEIWDGGNQYTIALEFGISQTIISAIALGKIWTHVPFPADRGRIVVSAAERKSPLSDETVRRVRALGETGLSAPRIALLTGASRSQVLRILSGQRYQHVA